MTQSDYLSHLFQRLHTFRQEAQLEPEQVEKDLVLGPGWIHAFESGATLPSLDMVVSMLSLYGKTLRDLAEGIEGNAPSVKRSISPEEVGDNLVLHFPYGQHNATYLLEGATGEQFQEVILTLRNGLAQLANTGTERQDETIETIKMESVANAFMKAVELWPQANPSDLWWFLVYRAYCDPYNHPAQYARLDFAQSRNTRPTPPDIRARARIYSCDFTNPDDAFTRFVIAESRRFRK